MARGRMLNKKVSNSARVNALPDGAGLLYCFLISHLDINGIFYGSAKMVKNLVVPRKKYGEKVVEKWLGMMEKSLNSEEIPLIRRYEVAGEQYLFMPGFRGEQVGLRADREDPTFPIPPNCPLFDGNMAASGGIGARQNPAEGEGEGEGKYKVNVKGKGRVPAPPRQNGGKDTSFIFALYEQTFGKTVPGGANQDMKDAEEYYPRVWIEHAFTRALERHKKNPDGHQESWPYVKGILEDWWKQGKEDDGATGRTNKARGRTGKDEPFDPEGWEQAKRGEYPTN